MQKTKIHIFGDSFSEDMENKFNVKRWFDFLSDEYEIINYSKAGTGPQYAFDRYYENDVNDKDVMIFLLSSSHRVPFKFFIDQCFGSHLSMILNESCLKRYEIDIKPYEDTYFRLLEHKKSIKDFYDVKAKEFVFENLKNILFLKQISASRKQKIFVFTCFDVSSLYNLYPNSVCNAIMIDRYLLGFNYESIGIKNDIKLINENRRIYDDLDLNDEYFYYHKPPLIEVTYSDFQKFPLDVSLEERGEFLENHLSPNNQKILGNFLLDRIQNKSSQLKFNLAGYTEENVREICENFNLKFSFDYEFEKISDINYSDLTEQKLKELSAKYNEDDFDIEYWHEKIKELPKNLKFIYE